MSSGGAIPASIDTIDVRQTHPSATPVGHQPNQLPFSHTRSRLASYPVVADFLTLYRSTILGSLSSAVYSTVSPVVFKVGRRPYQLISPIVDKADDLVAEHGLSNLERVLPIVKSQTAEVRDTATHAAATVVTNAAASAATVVIFPFRLLGMGKDRLVTTAQKAEEQARSDVYAAKGWAEKLVNLLRQRVDEASKVATNYTAQAADAASERAAKFRDELNATSQSIDPYDHSTSSSSSNEHI